MNIPYRTQRVLKRIAMGILPVLVLALVAGVCWYIWAQRYVVYTADGQAILDMTLPPMSEGKAPEKPEKVDVTIRYDTGANELEAAELAQMTGYYVEPEALKDLDTVKAQIQALPLGTPVMIDVKSIHGAFYYSSAVSDTRSTQVDVAKMDELLQWLKQQDLYTIAKFPALRDYTYGLNHVPDGVHHSSGGYLYQDDDGCYWLHPASQGTLSYLTQIIIELRNMGFDEVVLEDFCFPQNTDKIKVDGDRKELLTKAAAELLKVCATNRFALSFVKTEDFTPPAGRSRLYITGKDAAEAAGVAESSGVADPAINLVFLTELHDTRFNVYSVMRPLSGAH